MDKVIINNAKATPISTEVKASTGSKNALKEAHLTTKSPITRKMVSGRAYSLTENTTPHNGTPASTNAIIDFLQVEKSDRYTPTSNATFCNIYAHDFARAMGAYVPRVWWTEKAIKDGKTDTAVYAVNTQEMTANALYEWFPKYGSTFGWKAVKDVSEARTLANEGKCVIGVAANLNGQKSGHIVSIVPETTEFKSVGAQGIYIYPVQSQAGRTNRRRFVSNWWSTGHKPLKIYVKL